MRYSYRKINQKKMANKKKEVAIGEYTAKYLFSLTAKELEELLEEEWKKHFHLNVPYLG